MGDGVVGERRQLINVAYRLLGSLAEAEDAVQEAYARWYALPPSRRDEIASPGAWLTTVTGRICLDVLGSARARRERYVGAWLPDPLPGRAGRPHGTSGDPADQLVLDESVTMAFLVVLETMTPAERVAFVLHDVFRYPFAEVVGVLDRSPAACKQLAASARRRVRTGAPAPAAWTGRDRAARQGGVGGQGHRGPRRPPRPRRRDDRRRRRPGRSAALRPVEGGPHIARYMAGIAEKALASNSWNARSTAPPAWSPAAPAPS